MVQPRAVSYLPWWLSTKYNLRCNIHTSGTGENGWAEQYIYNFSRITLDSNLRYFLWQFFIMTCYRTRGYSLWFVSPAYTFRWSRIQKPGSSCCEPLALCIILLLLLQCCIMARSYSLGARFLDGQPVFGVDPRCTGLTPSHFLRHFYYGGIVYTGAKRWKDALDSFLMVSGTSQMASRLFYGYSWCS